MKIACALIVLVAISESWSAPAGITLLQTQNVDLGTVDVLTIESKQQADSVRDKREPKILSHLLGALGGHGGGHHGHGGG